MNNDLISREALKEEMNKKALELASGGMIFIDTINMIIDNAPTVDITEEQAIDKLHKTGWLPMHDKEMTERPQGEWLKIGDIGLAYTCNKCGEVNVIPTKFCPNCGARMKGGAE